MTVQLITPEGSLHPVPYHHVAVGVGTRHVHIAGQTARDPEGGSIADRDLAAQIGAALRQVGIALAAAGGSFADVVHLTFYVPSWDPSKIEDFTTGIESVTEELSIPRPWPPVTAIGVAQLWEPDILVEIEATAMLD